MTTDFLVEYDAPGGVWGASSRPSIDSAARAWNEALARCEALDAAGRSEGARVSVRHGPRVVYDWTRRAGHWHVTDAEARPS